MNSNAVLFGIAGGGKGVPYGGLARGDAKGNHGYKRLKGKTENAAKIFEVRDCPALASALLRLNSREVAFFTVGCDRGISEISGRFSCGGYLEIAFNSIELVANAQNYFKLFFDFHKAVISPNFWPTGVQCIFELQGADFFDGPAPGFTLTLWIQTQPQGTAGQSMEIWDLGLRTIVEFLEPIRLAPELTPIYDPGKPVTEIPGISDEEF